MFEDLIKDDAKLNSDEESGGIKRISIGSANTNINEVDTNGSVLLDTGEELEQADIEATKKVEGDTEIVELNSGGDSFGEALPDTTNVNPDSPHAKKFFTEKEREAMKKYNQRFTKEALESKRKVEEALESPEYPNTREELWTELCKKEEKFGREENEDEDLTEAEKDRKMVESMRNRGMDADYQHPDNKPVSEMTGKELKEALNGNTEAQEELEAEAEDNSEEEFEIEELEPEVKEMAKEAWQDRDDVFGEFANSDLSHDVPNTQVESMSDYRKITTRHEELQKDLIEMHRSSEKDTTVRKLPDGTIIAKVPKGEKY